MKSPQTYLIALLALTTIGGSFLAWQQYGELVELRAAAMNKDERAEAREFLKKDEAAGGRRGFGPPRGFRGGLCPGGGRTVPRDRFPAARGAMGGRGHGVGRVLL